MILSIKELSAKAASRPPGYLDSWLSAGLVRGDELDVPNEDYERIVAAYSPRPEPPGLLTMLGTLLESTEAWVAAGFPTVDDATLFDRSAHCAICSSWDALKRRCLQCGCYALKHRLATERCPLGKW